MKRGSFEAPRRQGGAPFFSLKGAPEEPAHGKQSPSSQRRGHPREAQALKSRILWVSEADKTRQLPGSRRV